MTILTLVIDLRVLRVRVTDPQDFVRLTIGAVSVLAHGEIRYIDRPRTAKSAYQPLTEVRSSVPGRFATGTGASGHRVAPRRTPRLGF